MDALKVSYELPQVVLRDRSQLLNVAMVARVRLIAVRTPAR
jgi:hypothetical protein